MNLERREWLARNPIRQWRRNYSKRVVMYGMSRRAFAQAVGCSIEALRTWEEGRNLPGTDDRSNGYLPDLARFMRMKEEDVLTQLKSWLNEKENGDGSRSSNRRSGPGGTDRRAGR